MKKEQKPSFSVIYPQKSNAEMMNRASVESCSVSFYLRDPHSGSLKAKHLVAVEQEEVVVEELEYLDL